ncbi:MAG: hypothetical protein WC822_03685 [Candidatus Paceibacterota bacterium]
MKKAKALLLFIIGVAMVTGCHQKKGSFLLDPPDSIDSSLAPPVVTTPPAIPPTLSFEGITFQVFPGEMLWESAVKLADSLGGTLPNTSQLKKLVTQREALGLDGLAYWSKETIPATPNCPMMVYGVKSAFPPAGELTVFGLLQDISTVVVLEDRSSL